MLLNRIRNNINKIYPGRIKYNAEFKKWTDFINNSQWWNEEQHLEFQWGKIQELLKYVYNYIPYYQELFKKLQAAPEDFKNFSDFSKFPFLTKDIIRERLEDMIPPGLNKKKVLFYNTGGSTGTPLSFYKTKRDDIIEKAFMTSQWSRVGYRVGDSRVILRGEVIKDGKLWEKKKDSNIWKFSAYHLSESNIKLMVDKINEIQPAFIHVYPTSMYLFTQLLKDQGLKLNFFPKAILCGSEKLYDSQRKLFEEFYHCRIYSWLGLAEQTILAGECEVSNKLHIFSEHSYVELIDTDGKVITGNGIQGEIIGTRLQRNIIPFIRYRSGDLSHYAEGPCSCKRNYKLLDDVDGRVQDVLISSENVKIPVTALFFGQHLKLFEKTLKIQLVQNIPGEALIRIVKGKNYNIEDEKQLLGKLDIATGSKIAFTISYVNDIGSTSRGKHKFLVSTL